MKGVEHHMFSEGKSPYSTMKQGTLGSCYLLAAYVGLDARPGALEKLFYNHDINDAGIYAMRMYMEGRPVYVHVDDYIPVLQTTRFGRSGWFPAFAQSTVEGELWPMIGEKVWAKLAGSYGKSDGGRMAHVMNHVTNDFNFSDRV